MIACDISIVQFRRFSQDRTQWIHSYYLHIHTYYVIRHALEVNQGL